MRGVYLFILGESQWMGILLIIERRIRTDDLIPIRMLLSLNVVSLFLKESSRCCCCWRLSLHVLREVDVIIRLRSFGLAEGEDFFSSSSPSSSSLLLLRRQLPASVTQSLLRESKNRRIAPLYLLFFSLLLLSPFLIYCFASVHLGFDRSRRWK